MFRAQYIIVRSGEAATRRLWGAGEARVRRSNCGRLRFGDFCRSILPERIFQFAARRSRSGMQRGKTKSGAVISGDMILKWKRIWSQVAAGL